MQHESFLSLSLSLSPLFKKEERTEFLSNSARKPLRESPNRVKAAISASSPETGLDKAQTVLELPSRRYQDLPLGQECSLHGPWGSLLSD